MKKKALLFFGAAIILLFLVSSASAGTIRVTTTLLIHGYGATPLPGPVRCVDLDTGIVKTRLNILGTCAFRGVGLGHDYKIYMVEFPEEYTVLKDVWVWDGCNINIRTP